MKLSTLVVAAITGHPVLRAISAALRDSGHPFDLDDAAAYLMAYVRVQLQASQVHVVYSPTRDLAC